ncbi:583_t:CDS:2 [Entrophospora sp. SA101]|nr:583_t:CDS:2 [Entrophospora sp. SA101]
MSSRHIDGKLLDVLQICYKLESVNLHLEMRQKRIESRLNNSIEIEVDADFFHQFIIKQWNYWFEALYDETFNDTSDESDLDDPKELKILLKHRVHPAANKRPNGNYLNLDQS